MSHTHVRGTRAIKCNSHGLWICIFYTLKVTSKRKLLAQYGCGNAFDCNDNECDSAENFYWNSRNYVKQGKFFENIIEHNYSINLTYCSYESFAFGTSIITMNEPKSIFNINLKLWLMNEGTKGSSYGIKHICVKI